MQKKYLSPAQITAMRAAYAAGVPTTVIGPPLGLSASLTVKRLRALGVAVRPKGSARLSTVELEAFALGVDAGLPLSSPDDELNAGRTWPDPYLNELFDLGVNLGASAIR
jgi:hypothetical protein